MKNPIFTYSCAVVMVASLAVFGLSYLATLFPPEYAPAPGLVRVVSVAALMASFTAATFASMKSTEWAEVAFRAGARHRHTLFFAAIFAVACIVIEVTLGKMGALLVFGVDIGPSGVFWLTIMLTFFAIAPRLLAAIWAGMKAIASEAAKADDQVEHGRTLDRIRAVNEATSQRIQAGVSNLEQERKARAGSVHGSIALVGAAAALLGAGGDPASAQVEYPTVETAQSAPASSANEAKSAPVDLGDEAQSAPVRLPLAEMMRGPRDYAKFERMSALLDARPSMSNRKLALAVGAARPTIKAWRAHYRAQQALAYAQNGALLDNVA